MTATKKTTTQEKNEKITGGIMLLMAIAFLMYMQLKIDIVWPIFIGCILAIIFVIWKIFQTYMEKTDVETVEPGEWEKADHELKKEELTAFNLFPDLKVKSSPNRVYNGAGYEIMEIRYPRGWSKEEQMKHTLALIEAIDKSST